jgi:hypothetical protein
MPPHRCHYHDAFISNFFRLDFIMRFLSGAFAAAFSAVVATSAAAVPLSGVFQVEAVNVTNISGTQSRAQLSTWEDALELAISGTGPLADANSDAVRDVFTYTGPLSFRVGQPQNADYTVAQWLATTAPLGGSVSDLSSELGARQLSRGNIGNGTAETTFFMFTLLNAPAADFSIQHDDGVAVFDDGTEIGFRRGPNGERTLDVAGFDGGMLQFLYVATNGNPSVFEVDADIAPIPLPASLPLLLGAIGFLGWRAKRRNAA